ncbi:hypothetical protein F4Z99_03795 [Candidatus Poribacteria bacterium]|nr:hypothetical protein [Candidatus Poribacteria bacterium]MYA99070.1 hypothetical protein [Candidatus Poribacteria bacterium]
MNKKRILFISILGIVLLCVGLFYWYTERQANHTKGRELFAPIYEYSGKLTPEEQKRFSELFNSIANVEPSVSQKYGLPKRELFQLEAHIMTLYRNNPELPFMGNNSASASLDVESYTPYFSIRALIAKTRLADLPADSRKLILSHLETFKKRLVKNSVEVYMREVRNLPDRPRQKAPPMRFGVASAPGEVGGEWVLEADGLVRPEGAKRGVFQITDVYGNEYSVDLDAPTDTGLTEDTSEPYAEIDRIFETLTEAELQRLSTLSKTDRAAEIEKLFSAE